MPIHAATNDGHFILRHHQTSLFLDIFPSLTDAIQQIALWKGERSKKGRELTQFNTLTLHKKLFYAATEEGHASSVQNEKSSLCNDRKAFLRDQEKNIWTT